MTSFSVTSIKKAISEFQEDSAQFTIQQKSDPLFPFGRASEASGHPSVFEKILPVQYASVPMTGATLSGCSSVFEKNLESFVDTDWEDSLQPFGC
jgi:uncharacterized Zn-finger protein